jgi:hypothetical protein
MRKKVKLKLFILFFSHRNRETMRKTVKLKLFILFFSHRNRETMRKKVEKAVVLRAFVFGVRK